MFEILTVGFGREPGWIEIWKQTEKTYARTLENSEVGDMTKLSFEFDHEIKCWIDMSSSILYIPREKGRVSKRKQGFQEHRPTHL